MKKKTDRRRAKVGDLVIVDWQDAKAETGWINKGDVLELAECRLVGWITRYDAKVLEIHSEVGVDLSHIGMREVMPAASVQKIEIVRKAGP